MPMIPYVHFQGQCAAAMTFYAQLFGSTDLQIMRYGDAPGAAKGPGAERVIHSQFSAGDAVFMASDFPEGQAGDKQAAVSIMYGASDVASGQRIFDALLEGGDVILPYGPSFFAKGFGMVRDRFGTHWMISAESQGAAPTGESG